jgi:hypothetical protein
MEAAKMEAANTSPNGYEATPAPNVIGYGAMETKGKMDLDRFMCG